MASLSDDTIYLRAIEPEDLDFLYKWENDTSLWGNGSTINPYSRFTLKEYITRSLDENILEMRQLRLMICLKESGKAVGTADIFDIDPFNNRAALGLFVTAECRKRGIAKRALEIVTGYAANTLLLHQIYVQIACDNSACIAMFDSSGFTKCGILKGWLRSRSGYADVAVYQKIL